MIQTNIVALAKVKKQNFVYAWWLKRSWSCFKNQTSQSANVSLLSSLCIWFDWQSHSPQISWTDDADVTFEPIACCLVTAHFPPSTWHWPFFTWDRNVTIGFHPLAIGSIPPARHPLPHADPCYSWCWGVCCPSTDYESSIVFDGVTDGPRAVVKVSFLHKQKSWLSVKIS